MVIFAILPIFATSMGMVDKIEKVEQVLKRSQLGRLIYSPMRYLKGHLHLRLFYARNGKEMPVRINILTGHKMKLLLPAGMDIYLFGCKTHASEIRLSKFLCKNLLPGQVFYDVGAHFGFYSLLAAALAWISALRLRWIKSGIFHLQ